MRSNCLFFAVALYRRRRKKGHKGYLMIRESLMVSNFPHVLYAERRPGGRLVIIHYKPNNPRFKTCPPPLFEGHTGWGD